MEESPDSETQHTRNCRSCGSRITHDERQCCCYWPATAAAATTTCACRACSPAACSLFVASRGVLCLGRARCRRDHFGTCAAEYSADPKSAAHNALLLFTLALHTRASQRPFIHSQHHDGCVSRVAPVLYISSSHQLFTPALSRHSWQSSGRCLDVWSRHSSAPPLRRAVPPPAPPSSRSGSSRSRRR